MKLSIITSTNFRNLVVLACSLLLVNIACKKDDVATAESPAPQKQAAEKIAANKADSTKPSTVIVEVNGTKLTQNDIDTELGGRLQAMKAQLPPGPV